MNKIFLDTSYVIALSVAQDQHHVRATHIADFLETEDVQIITTRAIILEIGNSLSAKKYRHAAVTLIESLEDDPDVVIVPASEKLYQQAFQLFKKRPDKEWGIIDCMSFVVMQDQQINSALTADKHFQQNGFKALLCD